MIGIFIVAGIFRFLLALIFVYLFIIWPYKSGYNKFSEKK